MALLTKAPRGTADMLPAESANIRYLENMLAATAEKSGFREIRTPVFEHTELFARGVGDTTDVVQKEMYTFEDNGNRSITLRPEGTAGCARAFLEHGLFNEPLPQKYYYLTSCYRYEKPQAGRLREFHQFGIECFGPDSPAADAEIIALAASVFKKLGVSDIKLEINSIGCPKCRKEYHASLINYFNGHRDCLCETCLGRLEKNPMRILDCKSPVCSSLKPDAPKVLDYLCEDCAVHFSKVQEILTAMGIEYTINPEIVRGLDYYSKTVFEFVSTGIGAQGTVCGGGRYDGLVTQLGGNPVPACGFGMGIERLTLLLKSQDKMPDVDLSPDIYIAPMNDAALIKAMCIVKDLREAGISAVTDLQGRSLKAQMKYSDKTGAKFTVVLGEDEIANNSVTVKKMSDGSTAPIALDAFAEQFSALTAD